MRSANSATTGPSNSALHLHLIDMGRFSLQFYTTGGNVAQKGTGCSAASNSRHRRRLARAQTWQGIDFWEITRRRHAIVRVCHARDSKGEPIEEPVAAVPAARRRCGD